MNSGRVDGSGLIHMESLPRMNKHYTRGRSDKVILDSSGTQQGQLSMDDYDFSIDIGPTKTVQLDD